MGLKSFLSTSLHCIKYRCDKRYKEAIDQLNLIDGQFLETSIMFEAFIESAYSKLSKEQFLSIYKEALKHYIDEGLDYYPGYAFHMYEYLDKHNYFEDIQNKSLKGDVK